MDRISSSVHYHLFTKPLRDVPRLQVHRLATETVVPNRDLRLSGPVLAPLTSIMSKSAALLYPGSGAGRQSPTPLWEFAPPACRSAKDTSHTR